MPLEDAIGRVREGLRAGRFANEASVSQGIVLPLLNALGWQVFDPEQVAPEYSLGSRRVDFALFAPRARPFAFIEVKQVGQGDGAERQLFEYAFHEGVPMAILTDGREWNFFLPAGQGNYGERRLYKLDLVDRDLVECVERLRRYLDYARAASGEALRNAQGDYQDVANERLIAEALPRAWRQLIDEADEMIVEILADKVESLCGYKPEPDKVVAFLARAAGGMVPGIEQAAPRPGRPARIAARAAPPLPEPEHREIGFKLDGRFYTARNAIDTLRQVFETLAARDRTFSERFAALPQHGRSRRYLAREQSALYPGRDDLCREYSIQLSTGWWMGTNHSRQTIANIIDMACGVAGLVLGRDLIANLGD